MDGESANGVGIMISSGVAGAALTVAGQWLKAKIGTKAKVTPEPSPFPVEKVPSYVTVQECNRRTCESDRRVEKAVENQQKILDKLDEIDSRSEKRAIATHDRLDPLVKELAKNIGQVELMKEAFVKSSIGSKK